MDAVGVLVVERKDGRRRRIVSWLSASPHISLLASGRDLIEACIANSPPSKVDVLVLGLDPLAARRPDRWALVHGFLPGVRVIALVEAPDDRTLLSALAAGVIALHPVGIRAEVLQRAVRNAAQGVPDFERSFAERVRVHLLRLGREARPSMSKDLLGLLPKNALGHLTRGEQEILRLVSLGLSNREVANRVHLSEKTVRNKVSAILEKLGFRNRTEAARWFVEREVRTN